MPGNMRPWAAGLLFILILGLAMPGWSATEDELTKKIEATKSKLSKTKLYENQVLGNLIQNQRELDRITDNLDQLSNRIGNAEHKISAINNELNVAQQQLDQIKVQFNGRKGILDQRLVAIYKYGYQSYLEVLFNAKDFAELVGRFELVGDYVRNDMDLLQALQKQQDQIQQKRTEIATKQQELEIQKNSYARLHNQTLQEQNRWQSTVQNEQQELATIQGDRHVLEQSLDDLEKCSKDMESQIKNYQNKNKSVLGTGHYIWPVPGTITSYFGWRFHPILKRRLLHTGIDIAAPYGTVINAADTGVVISSGYNGGYGKMLLIDHGGSFATVYAHCSVLLVGVGQVVNQGQAIAHIGSTGYSTGPHLHFEIRKNGVPVDPMTYL